MDNLPQVQADSHILVNAKLKAYEEMVLAKQKYIRLAKIHLRDDYPTDDWVLSLINFYDIMFSEVQENKYSEKYGDWFQWIPVLERGNVPDFDILNKITRNFMLFAQDVGITKTQKLGTEIHY